MMEEVSSAAETEYDCGLTPDGQCSKAGSEECDWDCPNSHGEYYAGSRLWHKKHNAGLPVDGCECMECQHSMCEQTTSIAEHDLRRTVAGLKRSLDVERRLSRTAFARHARIAKAAGHEVGVKPSSVAFHNMDADQFSAFLTAAIDYAARELVPWLPEGRLRAEAMLMARVDGR